MHRNLKRSLTAFTVALVALILIILNGCVHKPVFRSQCAQNSILAIISVREKYPTRVIMGRIVDGEGQGQWHAYGEVFLDGKWQALVVPIWSTVEIGRPKYELEDVRVFTGKQYMYKWARTLRDKED